MPNFPVTGLQAPFPALGSSQDAETTAKLNVQNIQDIYGILGGGSMGGGPGSGMQTDIEANSRRFAFLMSSD